jgi:phosphoglycerol transferase MdoB-like AlkP superfamily enzyme
MNKHAWSLIAGIAMTGVGLVLYFAFADVETPVIGLRQLGVVLAVVGVVELAVSTYAVVRSNR